MLKGLDIAKSVFQVHGINAEGKTMILSGLVIVSTVIGTLSAAASAIPC